MNYYNPKEIFGLENSEGFGSAPKYEGSGDVRFIQNFEKFKSYYVQAHGAKKRDFTAYAKKLTDNGFRLYDSNQVRECLFSTYTDGYNIVNLSFMKYKTPVDAEGAKAGETVSYINIAVESTDSSALPPLGSDEPAITTVQLTMLNSEPAFLIRMRDGRFIFIDGGVDGIYERVHADLFFGQLEAQNVREGKPVVAAWIITHPHADHIAGVMRTLQKYGDRFAVERVLCNFQSEHTIRKELGGIMETEGPYNYGWQMNLYNGVLAKFPEIRLITVHAGQRFVFAGLTMNILWTPENLCRPFEVGNDASVIYQLTGGEGSLLVTGDAQQINTKLTQAIWGDGVKSDLLLFAHHGYRARNVEFYAKVHAKYGIWTNSWESVLEAKENMFNNPAYNGVDPNAETKIIIPTNREPVLILSPGMPESELEPYIHNQEMKEYTRE